MIRHAVKVSGSFKDPQAETPSCLKYKKAPNWSIKMPQTEVWKCPKLKYQNAPSWSIKMPQAEVSKCPKLEHKNAPRWSIQMPQAEVSKWPKPKYKQPQTEVSKCPKLKYQRPPRTFDWNLHSFHDIFSSRPVLMICQHIDQKTPMFDIKRVFVLAKFPFSPVINLGWSWVCTYLPL